MSLILAIEPDRRRAAQLTGMARAHLRADLVVAATASQAVTGLNGRVPDILLTAPLLPSQEEAAIAEYLRQLGTAAAHVQTLTIPLLATGSGDHDRPVLSAFRRDRARRTEAEGCDPAVFAEQITEYLNEAHERREVPPPIAAPVVQSDVTPPVTRAVRALKSTKQVMAKLLAAAAEEKADDFIDYVVEADRPVPALVDPSPSIPKAVEPDLTPTYTLEPAAVVAPQEDDTPDLQSEWMSLAVQQNPSPALMPDESSFAVPAIEVPVTSVARVYEDLPTPTPARALPQSKRRRKAEPVQDEWGFFDPNQCGFPALIAKLDEIAGRDETDN